ncbi:hypothetical protein CON64_20845 [Bacillus pseudomycoides]|nr:hypothetical protein CON64_20845 [Bacillus pseudomycoides]
MKHTINLWSFIFSFICVGLLIFHHKIFSSEMIYTVMNLTHINPLIFLLVLTVVTFIGGSIGIIKVNTRKELLRSIITIVLTSLLFWFLIFILCLRALGNWLHIY